MKVYIQRAHEHISRQAIYMVMGFVLFASISYGLNQVADLYYRHFDQTRYYKITSPIPVEKKAVAKCDYVDVYLHRVTLVPIQGKSVKQLTLVRVDKGGLRERITSFTTDIQSEVGEATVIAHWYLPCDIPLGQYVFEGTVEYRVRSIQKMEHFFTEPFDVVASNSANFIN